MSEPTPEANQPQAAPTPAPKPDEPVLEKKKKTAESVVIRPYPKIIYLYPTFLAALVAGIIAIGDFPTPEAVGESSVLEYNMMGSLRLAGLIFWITFSLNLLVISFEFSRIKSIAILLGVIALIFIGLWVNGQYDIFSPIAKAIAWVAPCANAHFFFTIVFSLGIIYALVFVNTRFNYWELTHNELIHHHGFLGDVDRFPAPSMRLKKEISDVLEFALLQSGTLILTPAGEKRDILLENVLLVNRVEQQIKVKLETIKMTIGE